MSKTMMSCMLAGVCCLSTPLFANEGDVNAALDAAKAAQKKAATVGGEWRDVGKFIKKAEEAAKAGDKAKALKLATKAQKQSEIGEKQAVSQTESGPRF